MKKQQFIVIALALFAVFVDFELTHGQNSAGRAGLKEPVFRVTRNSSPRTENAPGPAAPTKHPLDPALNMAKAALGRIETGIKDYTCTLIKRERIKGELLEPEYMFTKIRNRQTDSANIVIPFSVYMKFLSPGSMKGREVIYVEQTNSGKLVAHEGGIKGRVLPTVWLKPDSALAMRNNRYPITEVGIATLTRRLIERGERDRKHQECGVEFFKGAKINGRSATCLQVTHPVERPYFDFHLARIFIDDELQVPIRYAAYGWPRTKDGKPELQEEYTYLDMKLNVGLSSADFDHKNTTYNF